MSTQIHPPRRRAGAALALLLAAALGACSAAPPAAQLGPTAAPAPPAETFTPAPTALPTVENPTVTPAPTALPTVENPTVTPLAVAPSPEPPANAVLPGPAYVLSGGQIARLERDGASVTQISFESELVLEYEVAANAGTIVYVYGDPEGERALAVLDGGGRRELLSGPVSAPAISPDGRSVVYRRDSPAPGQDAAGVWSIELATGEASLLRADDPLVEGSAPDGAAWVYWPIGYDGAGQRLLLWAYNQAGPGIPGGELVILNRDGGPELRVPTCCEGPQWSVDGSAITIYGGGPGPDIRFGLHRIDAATGVEMPLVEQGDASYPLVTGARQLLDGQVYAFYEDVPSGDYSWEYAFTPQMVRVSADGAIGPLRQDSYRAGEALWRDDASGALIALPDDQDGYTPAGPLLWLASGGAPALRLNVVGARLRWADTVQPLYDGDCARLPALAWQPPASRAFSRGAADLQGRLNQLGFAAGPADGFFGDATRAALRQFQLSRSLPPPPDGSLDCATWQALLGRP